MSPSPEVSVNASKSGRNSGTDRMLAAVAALLITGILLATAIIPGSPAFAHSTLSMGVLA